MPADVLKPGTKTYLEASGENVKELAAFLGRMKTKTSISSANAASTSQINYTENGGNLKLGISQDELLRSVYGDKIKAGQIVSTQDLLSYILNDFFFNHKNATITDYYTNYNIPSAS